MLDAKISHNKKFQQAWQATLVNLNVMQMKFSLSSFMLIAAAMNIGCQTVQNVDANADIEIILLGDVNLQTGAGAHVDRLDPASAFINVIDTLNGADLIYCNMEGLYGQTEREYRAR